MFLGFGGHINGPLHFQLKITAIETSSSSCDTHGRKTVMGNYKPNMCVSSVMVFFRIGTPAMTSLGNNSNNDRLPLIDRFNDAMIIGKYSRLLNRVATMNNPTTMDSVCPLELAREAGTVPCMSISVRITSFMYFDMSWTSSHIGSLKRACDRRAHVRST